MRATEAPLKAPPEQLELLRRIAVAVEDLLLSGTTTASEATVRTLGAAFEQASRSGFLRLGSTLRIAVEELKRLHSDPERFSGSRLAFFLDRAWLLASGTLQALQQGDRAALVRLTAPPSSLPVAQIEAATLGVLKRHVPGAFSAFEFRLRMLQPVDLGDGQVLPSGTPLLWSLVVPARADKQIPAEAFLALQQKQGFKPADLMEWRTLVIEQASVALGAPNRLMLGADSRLTLGDPLQSWAELLDWRAEDWLARLLAHRPDPLELPVELSEELLLRDWQLQGEFSASSVPGRQASERWVALHANGMRWRLRIDAGESAQEQSLLAAAQATPQPALFASVHVEHGEAVLSALALLGDKPDYLSVGKGSTGKAALLRALNGGA